MGDKHMIDEILEYNKKFVEEGGFLPYTAQRYPRKKLAVITCIDTRLVELLPAALGIHHGDVKMIKNAGAMILDPFDSSVRSLLIAILELKVEEVMVIAHTDCGAAGLRPEQVASHLTERGISPETIRDMTEQGLDFDLWFQGFDTPEVSVRSTVTLLRHHPLIPKDISIYGFVMDVKTGALTPVSDI